MKLPVHYEHGVAMSFGGVPATSETFKDCQAAILPIPFERTTSYMQGTKNGPREILQASTQIELWDEEQSQDVYDVGVLTLPEMEFPFEDPSTSLDEIKRVSHAVFENKKFLAALGGEHSITAPIVEAATASFKNLSVLQIDAHADLRTSYLGSPFSHACVMRRVLEHAPATQVGIRSISNEEAKEIPRLPTKIFYDINMREDESWIEKIIESLHENVYITVDCDGLNPGIMPAVGTPEPGGLSWAELLKILKTAFERRHIVGVDLVELCPIQGIVAPNVLCAKLIHKILTYRFTNNQGSRFQTTPNT